MSKTNTKVIVNPAAGCNSTYRKWSQIRSFLKNIGLKFDFQFTEGRGHGIELAKIAASDGYRYLVAVGGDGTVHEVANGVLQSQNVKETVLGMVNTGTGSDLPRSIGLPHDYSLACSSLTSSRRLIIDVGSVEYRQGGLLKQRYFINSAGIGFDATVVQATERMPKFFGGTIPYLAGLARTFLSYKNKNVSFKIGDKTEKARLLGLVVANGSYFGGGMHIAPEAKMNDNLLDVVIVGDFGKIELLRAFPRVYKGTHLTLPKIRLEKGTRIAVESKDKFLLHADGELLGEGPVSFCLLPQALSLVV